MTLGSRFNCCRSQSRPAKPRARAAPIIPRLEGRGPSSPCGWVLFIAGNVDPCRCASRAVKPAGASWITPVQARWQLTAPALRDAGHPTTDAGYSIRRRSSEATAETG